MRIAYICADPGVPVFGQKGCSIHVQEALRAFTQEGAEITLFAAAQGGDPPPSLEGIHIHPLSAPPKGNRAEREQAALRANEELSAALSHYPRFDFIYERYSLWSFAGMEFARNAGVPGILEVNAPLIDEQAEYRELIDRESAEMVANRVFTAANSLVAVSDEVAAYLLQYRDDRCRVHVIPNGVDPSRFPNDLQPSLPAIDGVLTVGFVGTLKRWHGVSILVDAFHQLHETHKNTRLLIVGDGPERAALEQDISHRGLTDSAYFTGAVPPSLVPGMLASMDIAAAPYPVLPNFYFSPLKVYEYMAAGLPVIASRTGQLNTLIEDGVTGYLCLPGDSVDLAIALEALLMNPSLRMEMGCRAREMVLNKFTWKAVARQIIHLATISSF